MILYADLETYSEVPIEHGTAVYAAAAEILLFAYAVDDGPAKCWDATSFQPMPDELWKALFDDSVIIVGHNFGNFDSTVLLSASPANVSPKRIHDTMIQALSHGLPGSLEKLCDLYRLGDDVAKIKDGKRLIQLFCKPRPKNQKLRRATRETHPEEWQRFTEYAKSDITSMRALYKKMPKWNYPNNVKEADSWVLDQKINRRGACIDVEFVDAAIDAAAVASKNLDAEIESLTEGDISSSRKTGRLLEYINDELGFDLSNLRGATLEKVLESPDIDDTLRELLVNRLQSGSTSVAKYKRLRRAVSHDGRVRFLLQFAGASRTARWAGRVFQPQNLTRVPRWAKKIYDDLVEMVKSGSAHLLFDNMMEALSVIVRACIIAPPGKKLCIADLSNIEGRVLAWLAGCTWKLEAFASGRDLYVEGYARSFGVSQQEVVDDDKAGGTMRLVGKVQELACFTPDTLVLTDGGLKAIVDVSKSDRLWDGVEWVKHAGVLGKGVKKVVRVDGIRATPEHLIRAGESWLPVSELVSNERSLSLALETGSASLPLSALNMEEKGEYSRSELRATVGASHTAYTYLIYVQARVRAATCALKKLLVNGLKDTQATQTLCQTTATVGAYSIESQPASTGVGTRTTQGTTTTAEEGSECILHGSRIDGSFCGISPPSKGGTIRRLSLTGVRLMKATPLATFASLPRGLTATTSGKSETSKKESTTLSDVYDIALAGPRSRFTIKTDSGWLIAHNCGYQGAVGAFQSMADIYGLDIEDSRALTLVKAWRAANIEIKTFWYDLEKAVKRSIREPGTTLRCRRIDVRTDGAWLKLRLPSGRLICYLKPELDDEGKISYLGVHPYTKKWCRIKTYGGKLVENVTQAVARDVLAENMPLAEANGYEIVLTVHDELITETADCSLFSAEALAEIMATVPPWAEGLPLDASGYETYRYRKD